MSKKLLSKRYIFLFCSLMSMLMIVVFRGPIFHFAIKTYVSHKIPLEGEWDFNYSYVSLQEHGIAFHDVTLLAEDESISCSIGKIFCYAPQVQKASLKNHFILEDVEIGFAKQMVSEGSSLSPDQLRSILRTLRQVEIKNGLLRIPSREVAFSLGKSVSSQKLGALVFSGDHHGLLKIDLSSWADRWIMDVEARQSSVKHFKAFFDFFMGEKVSKWEIESGKFDGRAFIAISSHNQIKDARLHFTLLNGKMKNEEAGIDSSFKRVFFDLDYPTSSEEKNLIDNIKFSSSIDGGSIHVYNENEETRFHFKDLSGFMTMDAFTEAAIDVTGFVEDGGRVLPVKFLGSPTTKNGDQLELDLALQIDPLFDQTARVHVLCSHDDGEFLLQTKFDSLEVRQMMIFQECISLFYPAAREFSISKGKYSGDMLVAFDQHGIKDFSLRNMLCSDVAFYSKSNDISFSASKVAGELELDLFHEKRTLVSGWEMDLEDGSLLIGREDGLPFHFENTTVKVTAKDGRFVDSYINTEISGIRGRADIDGSMQKPILDVLFSAKGEAFLQWFSSPASSYDNEVMISSRIEKEGDSFLGTGTMTLHDESYSSEIAFDFKGENKEIEEVTFHSEGILGRFYPFFNEVLGFDWSLDGDFSLHGKYDKEKILCAFTGRNATYREKHSMIKGAEGSGYFERNLASGDWSIDITLNKGHKKLFEEKKFCLKHAQLKISSGEKFFRVRSLEGFMDLDNSLQRLFVDVRRFDMTRGGKYYGDVALRNEDFELMRLLAKIEGGVLTLEEGSHLLEEKVALKECLFGEDWKISAQTIFHLDDIFFPKMVRERNIGDLYCALELDGTKYHFSAKGEKASASLKGVGKNFSVEVNGISFDAEVKDNAIYFGEGVIPYDNKHLHIKKGTLSRNGLFADGEVRGDGVDCTGSVEVAFAEGISCTGSLEGSFAPSNLQGYEIVTITPLQFSYDGKVTLEEAQCLLCENGHQLAKFFAKRVCFDDILEKIEISNLSAVVDKKVIQKKYEVDLLEDLSFAGDVILFPSKKDFVANIACEKQDVRLFEKELSFHQVVAKGNKKAFKINAKMPLFTDTIDLSMNAFFDKKTIVHLDGYLGSKKVLDADGLYEEEFELLRAKGELVGVTFDITIF
ncbi:hypothetical protein K0U07_03135 [bacterium]|nr:hypothetical protein [bacterium]